MTTWTSAYVFLTWSSLRRSRTIYVADTPTRCSPNPCVRKITPAPVRTVPGVLGDAPPELPAGGCDRVHHDRVHITPVEAALAAAAITAAAGIFAPAAVQRSVRRADHTARLWEQRAAVYEYVLTEKEWWGELRAETLRAIDNDDSGLISAPDSMAETDERRRLRARLQMFGEPDVRQAYDRSGEANKQFVIAVMTYRRVANLNLRAAQGTVPAHQAVAGEELVRLRHTAEAAGDIADNRAAELAAVVQQAVERLPRYQKRRLIRKEQ
jgi:hypothetical protein